MLVLVTLMLVVIWSGGNKLEYDASKFSMIRVLKMALTINSLRALTKLTRSPEQRYFVLAYFLPPQPYVSADEGEVFGYVCPLASFAHESEALQYRQHVEDVTQHPAIFAADAMAWSVLASRNNPNRIRHVPKTLESDIGTFYRKLREQEQIRAQLIQEFEERLGQEQNPDTVAHYARALYEGAKIEEKLVKLEDELVFLKELLAEKKQAVKKHHQNHPEHDVELDQYFRDHLGDMNSAVYKHYLQEWTRPETLIEQMRRDQEPEPATHPCE